MKRKLELAARIAAMSICGLMLCICALAFMAATPWWATVIVLLLLIR